MIQTKLLSLLSLTSLSPEVRGGADCSCPGYIKLSREVYWNLLTPRIPPDVFIPECFLLTPASCLLIISNYIYIHNLHIQ